MDLYQAGYCGIGNQGINDGWQIVAASKGMSSNSKDGFEGISTTLLELKDSGMPQFAKGLFESKGFYYLIHVNYLFLMKNADVRRLGYVHCMCFDLEEYYEMSSTPEMLAGISSNTFPIEYDDSIESYPVINGIPYTSKDINSIMDKYGISDSEYREIMLGVLGAIESKNSSLCIKKKDVDFEQYEDFYNDILYLILKGLPYHLRIRTTSFSFRGCKNTFHVSDQIDSDNYIDLDTNECHVDHSRVSGYEFTKLYNGSPSIRELDQFWNIIAQQTEKLFKDPLKSVVCCEQVEAAFQSTLKKSEAEGIDPRNAESLLTALFNYDLNESKELYVYLTDLLALINENGILLNEKNIADELSKRYERALYPGYQDQLNLLNLRNLIDDENTDRNKKFDMLSEIESNNPERFASIFNSLRKQSPELAYGYYFEKQLPNSLRSFDDVEAHITNIGENVNLPLQLRLKDYNTTINALLGLAKNRINQADDFRTVSKVENRVSKLLRKMLSMEAGVQQDAVTAADMINTWVWERFEPDWFDPEETKGYRECDLERMAEKDPGSLASRVLELCELCDIASSRNIDDIGDDIMKMVYEDKYGLSSKKLRELQTFFFSKLFENGFSDPSKSPGKFDIFMSLLYDADSRYYPIINIGSKLMKVSDGDAFDSSVVMKNIRAAKTLTSPKYAKQFKRDLDSLLDGNNDSVSDISPQIIKGLRKYKDALEGKELKSDYELESINLYLTSLYRIPIFVVSAIAYAIFMYDLWKCTGYETKTRILILAIGATAAVIATIIGILLKVKFEEAIEYIADNSGLESGLRKAVYFVILIGLIALTGVTYWFRASWVLILAFIYIAIAIIAMIVGDSYLEE